MSEIDEWVNDEQGKHFCQCGCSGKIIIKPHHYKKGIPKYLPAHHANFFYNKIVHNYKRIENQNWVQQEQGKHFCHCGCGQDIKIMIPHRTKGIPKYLNGHHHKILDRPSKAFIEKWVKIEQTKNRVCLCGCGSKIIIKQDHYTCGIPKYIIGHYSIGKKLSDITKKKIADSRIGKYVGPNSPNWRGGISYEPYCHKFNNELKERVRNRDNRTCQKCGCKENGRKLSVHHIHYDKDNCYPDLISLCLSCHTSSNANRNYWEEYYMNILETRGLLNWS